jgi:hypothetical protein
MATRRVPAQALYQRLRAGWSLERALAIPYRARNPQGEALTHAVLASRMAPSPPSRELEARRRQRAERVRAGLCWECDAPATQGRRCATCAERHRQRNRRTSKGGT